MEYKISVSVYLTIPMYACHKIVLAEYKQLFFQIRQNRDLSDPALAFRGADVEKPFPVYSGIIHGVIDADDILFQINVFPGDPCHFPQPGASSQEESEHG